MIEIKYKKPDTLRFKRQKQRAERFMKQAEYMKQRAINRLIGMGYNEQSATDVLYHVVELRANGQ